MFRIKGNDPEIIFKVDNFYSRIDANDVILSFWKSFLILGILYSLLKRKQLVITLETALLLN